MISATLRSMDATMDTTQGMDTTPVCFPYFCFLLAGDSLLVVFVKLNCQY